jgi:3-mercaptopyruvate sulfurtransferase SseA
MGYKNAKALGGGVEAWKKAGYPLTEDKQDHSYIM